MDELREVQNQLEAARHYLSEALLKFGVESSQFKAATRELSLLRHRAEELQKPKDKKQ